MIRDQRWVGEIRVGGGFHFEAQGEGFAGVVRVGPHLHSLVGGVEQDGADGLEAAEIDLHPRGGSCGVGMLRTVGAVSVRRRCGDPLLQVHGCTRWKGEEHICQERFLEE